MSRSRSSNSVSLFPFLAVLVCAMGSLIFLLIVTTQRIRSETVARKAAERLEREALKAEQQRQVVKPALPMEVSPSVSWPEPVPAMPEASARIEPIPGLVKLGPAQAKPVFPPVIAAPIPPEPQPIWPAAIAEKPAPPDPNIPLKAEYAELEKARNAWREAVQNKESALVKLKQQVDSLTESLRRINSQIEESARERASIRDAQQQLIASRNAILGQLAKVEKEIEETKNQKLGSPTKFQVVPFDGLTGTNYRPIIIECTAEGMRFQPEDVLVTEADFEGFTLGKNPLLAGTRALSDYWTKVSARSDGKEPMPYVLLIVRPSGAKYYAAKQLLDALDRPFGYELVEESLPIDIPPKDPIAAELCKNAVADTLKERNDLKKLIASHGPEALSRNPNYRVIRKPQGGFEVEYSPDGKFREQESGSGRSPFGGNNENPFGGPSSPGNPGNISGNPPGGSRSPLVSPLPGPSSTGSQAGEAIGRDAAMGSRRPGSDADPGGTPSDPRQPRLLPEDIIRRSQGQRPYQGDPGSGGGFPRAETPGTGDSQDAGSAPNEPGSANYSNQDVAPLEPGQAGSSRPADMMNPAVEHGSANPKTGEPRGSLVDVPPPAPVESESPGTQSPSGQSGNPSIVDAPPMTPQETTSPARQSPLGQKPPEGTAGTGMGSPTAPGTPSSVHEPAMPNFSALHSRRMQNQWDPYQRRWGLSDPRASIGFEREITVRVEPGRLVVGNAFAVSYDERTTKDQLAVGMLEAIELSARKWGRPPMNFYWVPTIRFQVANDQVPVYRHLTAAAQTWGLETSAEGIE